MAHGTVADDGLGERELDGVVMPPLGVNDGRRFRVELDKTTPETMLLDETKLMKTSGLSRIEGTVAEIAEACGVTVKQAVVGMRGFSAAGALEDVSDETAERSHGFRILCDRVYGLLRQSRKNVNMEAARFAIKGSVLAEVKAALWVLTLMGKAETVPSGASVKFRAVRSECDVDMDFIDPATLPPTGVDDERRFRVRMSVVPRDSLILAESKSMAEAGLDAVAGTVKEIASACGVSDRQALAGVREFCAKGEVRDLSLGARARGRKFVSLCEQVSGVLMRTDSVMSVETVRKFIPKAAYLEVKAALWILALSGRAVVSNWSACLFRAPRAVADAEKVAVASVKRRITEGDMKLFALLEERPRTGPELVEHYQVTRARIQQIVAKLSDAGLVAAYRDVPGSGAATYYAPVGLTPDEIARRVHGREADRLILSRRRLIEEVTRGPVIVKKLCQEADVVADVVEREIQRLCDDGTLTRYKDVVTLADAPVMPKAFNLLLEREFANILAAAAKRPSFTRYSLPDTYRENDGFVKRCLKYGLVEPLARPRAFKGAPSFTLTEAGKALAAIGGSPEFRETALEFGHNAVRKPTPTSKQPEVRSGSRSAMILGMLRRRRSAPTTKEIVKAAAAADPGAGEGIRAIVAQKLVQLRGRGFVNSSRRKGKRDVEWFLTETGKEVAAKHRLGV